MNQEFPKLILPVPQITQQRIGDCLVACVGMLLTYQNKPFHYRRAARQMKTQQFGTVFSNIRHLRTRNSSVFVDYGDLDRFC